MSPLQRLHERESELDALAKHRADVADGAGGVLCLRGEAGIGKSELLAEAVAAARARGMTVCVVRGTELEEGWAWGVARQLLEALLRQAGDRDAVVAGAGRIAAGLLEPQLNVAPLPDASFALMHGLYWACVNASASAPVLLAVDDAHWSDEPSLRFLAFIARRVREHRIGVLMAMRPGGLEFTSVVARMLGRGDAVTLHLRPLSATATAAIARARFGAEADDAFVLACHRWTGGNPFYLRELLSALVADGVAPTAIGAARVADMAPRGLTDALLLRLAQLGSSVLEMARCLAVLGDGARLDELAALTKSPLAVVEQALEVLAQAGVVSAGEGVSFSHPIVRASIYRELTGFGRARRHRQASEVLHAAGRSDDRVVAQLRAAGPVGAAWVIETLERAAAAAMARGAPELATELLHRALHEPCDTDQQAALEHQLGRAQSGVEPSIAVKHFRRAATLSHDPNLRADAAVGAATALVAANHADDALRLIAEVEPSLTAEQSEQAMLLESLALIAGGSLAQPGRWDTDATRGHTPAARTLLASMAFGRAVAGEPADVVVPLANGAISSSTRRAEGGIDTFLAAHFVLVLGERFDEEHGRLSAILEDARTRGSLLWFASASVARSVVNYRAGSLGDAEADARQALDAGDGPPPFWSFQACVSLALTLTAAGRVSEAAEMVVAAGPHLGPAAPPYQHALLEHARGTVAYADGAFDDAASHFLAAGEHLLRFGARNPAALDWRSQAALALARTGARDQARELVAGEVALARGFGAPRAIGAALRANALVVEPVSIGDLEQAVEVLNSSPARLDRARALLDYGAALRRAGQRAAAREPLSEGLDLAARCGAHPLIAQAREELLAAGARPRGLLRHGVDALTASERRIAQLAADGRSNPEIAQSLFLSPRTVESHLGHAYRKLAIARREELQAALARSTPMRGA